MQEAAAFDGMSNSLGGRFAPIYDALSSEERHSLSHSKRFLERFSGDEIFRDAVLSGVYSLKDSARDCGCEIDVTTLRPVFDPSFAEERANLDNGSWPLAAQWRRYMSSLLNSRPNLTAEGNTRGANPAFDAWRDRQIGRTAFDVGYMSSGITHPPVAFELSSGCSVGCWFCGISADRFKGHFQLTPAGRQEWRRTLKSVQAVLGPALSSGFLYWATEPLDNPDYLGFLDDFNEATGVYPQTTTAIPLRNVELTRAVLARWEAKKTFPNRFSILNTSVLKKVHAEFAPEEMLGVELVLQNRGNTANSKTGAGRAFSKPATESDRSGFKKGFRVQSGTIACVTGFLVNIVERTIRLVSPCMANEDRPNGYIVFDERAYVDAADLEAVMSDIVAANMPMKMRPDVPMRIAENIEVGYENDRFLLESASSRMRSEAVDLCAPFISAEGETPRTMLKRALEDGQNPFKVTSAITTLWRAGLLSEARQFDNAILAA